MGIKHRLPQEFPLASRMKITNLGYITDLIFNRLNGVAEDMGDYTIIRTPSNPTYHWGNFLLFPEAPTSGCFDKWMAISDAEFGKAPGHIAFGWQSAAGCSSRGLVGHTLTRILRSVRTRRSQ